MALSIIPVGTQLKRDPLEQLSAFLRERLGSFYPDVLVTNQSMIDPELDPTLYAALRIADRSVQGFTVDLTSHPFSPEIPLCDRLEQLQFSSPYVVITDKPLLAKISPGGAYEHLLYTAGTLTDVVVSTYAFQDDPLKVISRLKPLLLHGIGLNIGLAYHPASERGTGCPMQSLEGKKWIPHLFDLMDDRYCELCRRTVE